MVPARFRTAGLVVHGGSQCTNSDRNWDSDRNFVPSDYVVQFRSLTSATNRPSDNTDSWLR